MKIDTIHSLGYDAKGCILSNRKPLRHKGNRGKKTIDAVIFDAVEFSEQPKESYLWLASYIRKLPDTIVKDRLNNYRDSFESIEDCLVDKIIAEEI